MQIVEMILQNLLAARLHHKSRERWMSKDTSGGE
jgi:hypothetical protein